MVALALGCFAIVARRFLVLMSLSMMLRTVNTAVYSGYFAKRCWTAGMARELLAAVIMMVPAMA